MVKTAKKNVKPEAKKNDKAVKNNPKDKKVIEDKKNGAKKNVRSNGKSGNDKNNKRNSK